MTERDDSYHTIFDQLADATIHKLNASELAIMASIANQTDNDDVLRLVRDTCAERQKAAETDEDLQQFTYASQLVLSMLYTRSDPSVPDPVPLHIEAFDLLRNTPPEAKS